jgi:hypothetical protein
MMSGRIHAVVQRNSEFPAHSRTLSLAWKILLFVVCGALVFGSVMLMSIKVQSADLLGTVVSHGAYPSDQGYYSYLIIQLDNGSSVRVPIGSTVDYRPRRRVAIWEATTSFFGLKKYQFERYLDESIQE